MRSLPWLAVFVLVAACERAPIVERASPAVSTSAEAMPPLSQSATIPPPLPSASASARTARPVEVPLAIPSALASSPPHPLASPHAGFQGPVDVAEDAAWIRRLGGAPIASLRWNGGGTSVTLRARFEDGRTAVMKPAQTRSSSNHRGEIAAYHVDRLVGFGRTAVVVGRRVPRSLLEQATQDDGQRERIATEVRDRDGVVEVAMIAWHDGPLAPDPPPPGALVAGPPLAPALARRTGAWSDLHVFDFLIDNTDRWSGGNVLAKGRGGPLVFLDNASSFLPGRARQGATIAVTLAPVCRFAPSTVAAVRALATHEPTLSFALGASLAKDPLAPVLDPATLSAIDARVAALVRHIDDCIAAHGADTVLLPDGATPAASAR